MSLVLLRTTLGMGCRVKGTVSPAFPPVRYTVPWMEPSGLRAVAHCPKRTAHVRNIVCLCPL